MSTSEPLRATRLGTLFFCFAFSVIGGSVGLNALIKSNQERSLARNSLAALGGTTDATINIDINDVFSSGAVITAVCALLALLSGVFFAFTWCPVKDKRFWFRLQSCALFFCAIWLFATLIPFDYFFANREAQVSASVNGVPMTADLIQAFEQLLGITPVYRDISYLRLLAVLPWFALLFSVIAGVVLHFAARRAGAAAAGYDAKHSVSDTEHREKDLKEPEREA
ncbi:hypothetical protein BU15DRAFT_53449 [Melanogaster broomeanus]|nr:hypothetical protein BU15DRAFT_53449 [Melanogaster broomeanus]